MARPRARWDRERARELESYLEIETADNVARGLSPDDARDAARRKLGNLTRIREEIHDMNTIGWFDRLAGDLRFALRLLRTNAAFTIVAIASLALGIGANTAIFQLLDAVRLRSLPVVRPHEIVEVRIAGGNGGMGITGRYCQLTRPQWTELQRPAARPRPLRLVADDAPASAATAAWCRRSPSPPATSRCSASSRGAAASSRRPTTPRRARPPAWS